MGAIPGVHERSDGVRWWRGLVPVLLAAVAVAALLLATAGCDEWFGDCDDEPTETRDDTFTVGNSTRLIVKTGNGGIEVSSGRDGEVHVQATLRVPDRIDYSVTQEGDTITVEARPESGRWRSCMQASIIVTVPVTTDVDLQTSNGAIDVYGIEGTGRLDTSNGAIAIGGVKGDFEGGTSNGRITIDGMDGAANLETSNGAVSVEDARGEFDLETSNGRISFSGELTAGGNSRLETSNGRVEVELLGTPSVSLEASTSNGDITTELPLTVSSVSKDRLVGTIGDGEADLYISTSNGDVSIR